MQHMASCQKLHNKALHSDHPKQHGFRCATATPPWVADELGRSTLT